jgi:hypothetical protein
VLGPHTITVVRAATSTGDYGNRPVLDWSNTTDTEVRGCNVQPAPASTFTVDRDSFITRFQAFVPPDTDVRSTDRVVWDGNTYDVDGDVLRWDFPGLSHLVVNLRRSQDA